MMKHSCGLRRPESAPRIAAAHRAVPLRDTPPPPRRPHETPEGVGSQPWLRAPGSLEELRPRHFPPSTVPPGSRMVLLFFPRLLVVAAGCAVAIVRRLAVGEPSCLNVVPSAEGPRSLPDRQAAEVPQSCEGGPGRAGRVSSFLLCLEDDPRPPFVGPPPPGPGGRRSSRRTAMEPPGWWPMDDGPKPLPASTSRSSRPEPAAAHRAKVEAVVGPARPRTVDRAPPFPSAMWVAALMSPLGPLVRRTKSVVSVWPEGFAVAPTELSRQGAWPRILCRRPGSSPLRRRRTSPASSQTWPHTR